MIQIQDAQHIATEFAKPQAVMKAEYNHDSGGASQAWISLFENPLHHGAAAHLSVFLISDVGDTSLVLIRQIAVSIKGEPGNFVAEFSAAKIFASGDSEEEAIENIKETIAATFESYSSYPQQGLGEEARGQLAALRRFLKRA